MASATNEARRRRGKWGLGRGCSTLHRGGVWGDGYAPPHNFFLDLWAQNGKFWCIVGANFIAVELTVLHA